MNDCNKCIWATRSGECVSWECKFVEMGEAYKATMQMKDNVNRQSLITQLRHLNKFNNNDCPEWVFKVIEGM